MSSRSLIVSLLAQADVRSILQFSEEQWGTHQRASFGAELTRSFQELTTFPFLGRPRDDLKRGLRGLVVKDHLILYQVTAETVTVLRIIHTRRDSGDIIGI